MFIKSKKNANRNHRKLEPGAAWRAFFEGTLTAPLWGAFQSHVLWAWIKPPVYLLAHVEMRKHHATYHILESRKQYSSRVIPAVRMLFLMISASISSYSGITTAHLAYIHLKIRCEPFLRLYLQPCDSNILIKVFQSTGVIFGIQLSRKKIFQSQPSQLARYMIDFPAHIHIQSYNLL